MSATEQLYTEIKNLRTVESALSVKCRFTFQLGYKDSLIERKVKAMQRIGKLNRELYSKKH